MDSARPTWYAVFTRPRQEKTALAHLQRQGFECFLPMADNPYQRQNKSHKHLVEPLFPRYLFLKAIAAIQNLAPVRSTRGVISMVRFGTELAVVPDAVINAIKNRMETTSGLIRIAPAPVNTGDKVRVFDGPLAGVSGIVEEWNSENRALILMELLGRSTRVEVDAMILQKAG